MYHVMRFHQNTKCMKFCNAFHGIFSIISGTEHLVQSLGFASY